MLRGLQGTLNLFEINLIVMNREVKKCFGSFSLPVFPLRLISMTEIFSVIFPVSFDQNTPIFVARAILWRRKYFSCCYYKQTFLKGSINFE